MSPCDELNEETMRAEEETANETKARNSREARSKAANSIIL